MRVAIFVTNAPGNYGGGRLAAYVLAQCLARAGAEVAFCTNHVPVFHEDLHAFGRPGKVDIFVTKNFQDALPEGGFDVVVLIPTQSLDRMVYVGARGFARRRGARLCIFNFETPNWFNAAVPVARDEVLWREWRLATEDVADNGVLVLSNSRESEKYARLWYGDDRLMFDHWHQPINLDALNRAAPQYRENRILCFVRPRDPHKGAQDIIDVLGEEMRGWTLSLIVGSPKLDEAYRDTLVPVARRYGIEVEVRPLASDTEKFVELKRARVLLYPSWFEGYGLPPIEALSAGTPCVCYDLDVFREVCGDALITAPVGDVAGLRRGLLEVMRSSPEDWRHLPEAVASVASVEACGRAALESLQRFLDAPLPARRTPAVPNKPPRRPERRLVNLGAAVMHPGWLLELRGWAAVPPDSSVLLYVDRELLGTAQRGMTRTDVLAAQPWVETAEVGFGLVRPHVAMGDSVQVTAVALAADGAVLDHATRIYDLAELAAARPKKPPAWWRTGGMKYQREADSALVSGWAAGAPVPMLIEGFAGPRRVWLQGGRARPDVIAKLEGFPQQSPAFAAHLTREESWMLEAAGEFTLVGYGPGGIAVQRMPVKWERATAGKAEPSMPAEDPTSLPFLAELKRAILDEYGVLEIEGHVLSRPRVEAIRVLLDGELMGETLPDRLQAGLHNKNRAYGDAYSGFALNARAPNLPGAEARVEFIRDGEVAHAMSVTPERVRRGKGKWSADAALLPPTLLTEAGSGVTLLVIGDNGPLAPVAGAPERALMAELRRRGPLVLLLHGNPHHFTADLARWQALSDGILLLNDLHPGPDALLNCLDQLSAEPGLGAVMLLGQKRPGAVPLEMRATTLWPAASVAAAPAEAIGFEPGREGRSLGPDAAGVLAALRLDGVSAPSGKTPWIAVDATRADPHEVASTVSALLEPAGEAGSTILCVVDAPPLMSPDAVRLQLGLPAEVALAWVPEFVMLDRARVIALVDPCNRGDPSSPAVAALGMGVPVVSLQRGGPWPCVAAAEVPAGGFTLPALPEHPYAVLDEVLSGPVLLQPEGGGEDSHEVHLDPKVAA
ncbi:glycosyltransferase family 4 protein [Roseomonas elaeocarpi]|uniref:Glycosyltransferase family 4 protein n=1 Tax=Roseomonas elaeocarpi TaxID=907779 RepID=A0ABV6JS82_9PROT